MYAYSDNQQLMEEITSVSQTLALKKVNYKPKFNTIFPLSASDLNSREVQLVELILHQVRQEASSSLARILFPSTDLIRVSIPWLMWDNKQEYIRQVKCILDS